MKQPLVEIVGGTRGTKFGALAEARRFWRTHPRLLDPAPGPDVSPQSRASGKTTQHPPDVTVRGGHRGVEGLLLLRDGREGFVPP